MEKPRSPIKVQPETGWKPRLPVLYGEQCYYPQKTWDGPEVRGSVLFRSQEVHNGVSLDTDIAGSGFPNPVVSIKNDGGKNSGGLNISI